MSGWIIPAPFAWAETVTPPQRTVQLFGKRSVVMIASAKLDAALGERRRAASPIPATTASIGSGTPIFPVSAIGDLRAARGPAPRPRPARIASASRIPCSPVSALALPALTDGGTHAAGSQRSRQTRTGAAAEALRVSSSAEAQRSRAARRPARRRSRRSPSARRRRRRPRNPGASRAGSSSSTPAGGIHPAGAEEASRRRVGALIEPLPLVEAEHQVEVLDRLAGGALPEVVDRREGEDAAALLDRHVDVALVGVAHVAQARAARRPRWTKGSPA